MPDHSWKCEKCGNGNPPYTEACRECGLMADGSRPVVPVASRHAENNDGILAKLQAAFGRVRRLGPLAFLRSLANFLRLLLWTCPFRREQDTTRKFDMRLCVLMMLLSLYLAVFEFRPYFTERGFPHLSRLTVISGVLIEHPTERDSKYHTAPIGVRTASGDVFKRCSSLGVTCWVDNKTGDWRELAGKPARMWYLGDWMVQLEIDGAIPRGFSYGNSKRMFTSLTKFWLSFLVLGYFLFRIVQRYLKPAAVEAFGRSGG
jgi:hypothetical protein